MGQKLQLNCCKLFANIFNESFRSLEVLEIQVTDLSFHLGSRTLCRGIYDPVCNAATAGDPGPTYQSVLKELLSIGAIDSALLSQSFYSCLFLVANATEGVDTDNISPHPQRLHVLLERHYGNTLVNPLGPPEGLVVYIPI